LTFIKKEFQQAKKDNDWLAISILEGRRRRSGGRRRPERRQRRRPGGR
jgi:hypothetical protein